MTTTTTANTTTIIYKSNKLDSLIAEWLEQIFETRIEQLMKEFAEEPDNAKFVGFALILFIYAKR